MNETTQTILKGIAIAATLYLWAAGITWQFRNPTANQATLIAYLPQVVTFQKLEKFQAK